MELPRAVLHRAIPRSGYSSISADETVRAPSNNSRADAASVLRRNPEVVKHKRENVRVLFELFRRAAGAMS